MKLTKIAFAAVTALIIAACSASKKTVKSTASTTPPATTTSVSPKSSNGVFAPGNEELLAIQKRYKEVTMQTLKDGYAIYTGACVGCHPAKSIYSRPEQVWPAIMDDMAQKARITGAQKDAVYKYVLAIKGTQPKDVKTFQNGFLGNEAPGK